MIHQSVTPFGARPVSACLLRGQRIAAAPAPISEVNKWTLFHQLRACRSSFGLNNRDLVVLNALLTFHPDAALLDGAQLVVFPSNAALSDRAHGMAESTLRRHLAALVTAGIISRNDSPNGKRFAARSRAGAVVQAYGFNLRPLLVQAAKIGALADAAQDAALSLKLARQSVVTKLRDIRKVAAYAEAAGIAIEQDTSFALLDEVSKALRRKLSLGTLQNMAEQLDVLLVDITGKIPSPTEEMSVYDSQNERHYQKSHTENFDSEPEHTSVTTKAPVTIRLDMLLKACPDIQDYAQNPIRTWRELSATAQRVYPMMGISHDGWTVATAKMGEDVAAGVLAAMLQRAADIRIPGGYLRKLVGKYVLGSFNLTQMIMSLLNRPQLASA